MLVALIFKALKDNGNSGFGKWRARYKLEVICSLLLCLCSVFNLVNFEPPASSVSTPVHTSTPRPTATPMPTSTPKPTPTPDPNIGYNTDGSVDWVKDSKGIVWTYYYDGKGSFAYREAKINPSIHFLDHAEHFNNFDAYPAHLDETYSCMSFTVNLRVYDSNLADGTKYVIYVLEPEVNSEHYQDEGRIEIINNKQTSYTVKFSSPTKVSAICPRPYTNQAYSFRYDMFITDMVLRDYSYYIN